MRPHTRTALLDSGRQPVGTLCLALCWVVSLNTLLSLAKDKPSSKPGNHFQLTFGGEVERALTLGLDDLNKLPHQKVRVKDPDGKMVEFEGVQLLEVLRLAGKKLGEKLRGDDLATYLIVGAADEYRVVFALPELDPAFTDRLVLLVDRRDQEPLSKSEGPLRLVIPDEKRRARWFRQVNTLRIHRAVDLDRDSSQ
jgi:DMSO/TMAO reductase YedYZ molybdopterin-dependent catalytic subunit